jgi:hypothetical protein
LKKIFVLVGVILILFGGLLSIISITPSFNESITAYDDIMSLFISPDPPLHLQSSETITANFDVSGTPPNDEIVFGVTTVSDINSVLINGSIIDETFTIDEFWVEVLDTAESDEGGLLVFSWEVSSSDNVYFGVFDTEGYLSFFDGEITISNFEYFALVYGNLQDGIGYIKTAYYDDYFFLLLNNNPIEEIVTVEVLQVTIASVPYLESSGGTTQASVTYQTQTEDEYVIIVELPVGTYSVALTGELDSTYPYQMYGVLIVVAGILVLAYGVIVKPKSFSAVPNPAPSINPPPVPNA